jgi:hypothetical protein
MHMLTRRLVISFKCVPVCLYVYVWMYACLHVCMPQLWRTFQMTPAENLPTHTQACTHIQYTYTRFDLP